MTNAVTNAGRNAVTNGTPTHPDLTRPDPTRPTKDLVTSQDQVQSVPRELAIGLGS